MAYVYAGYAVHVTIFSTGGKFWPVSNFMELHAPTLATCSYALLMFRDKIKNDVSQIILHFASKHQDVWG